MLPDRVWNPGPLTYESGALPIALRCPAGLMEERYRYYIAGQLGQHKLCVKFSLFSCVL